ncbi:hypothetical protein H072_6351 [Dactylellina haptotyla CBS 200.50]|uniref:F-box domain-containing protein n=1 Tax=Dactylellina haptotyla (strain CBS 200.50) TaxID=1284197 RepID=S8BX94_DACHA|nr:hypothetical protein H072_6351 [Dactylellina haptotyla CBS 200.50]
MDIPPLLQLPPEILHLIFQMCDRTTLKNIRQVHSALKNLVNPTLFRTLRLSLPYLTKENYIVQFQFQNTSMGEWSGQASLTPRDQIIRRIEALETRQSLPFLFDNVLEIFVEVYDYYDGYPNVDAMMQSWPNYSDKGVKILQDFLCSMKKLRTLGWQIPYSNITRLIDLSSLSTTVTDLHLGYHEPSLYQEVDDNRLPAPPAFDCFKALYRVTSLDITFPDSGDITALNYFPNLKALGFNVQEKTDRWRIREREAIREGRTLTPPSLVDFLQSQSATFKLRILVLRDRSATHQLSNFPNDLTSTFLSDLDIVQFSPNNTRSPQYTYTKIPIFNSLLDTGVYPRNLSLQYLNDSTLEYLISYPPILESLDISAHKCRCEDDSRKNEYEGTFGLSIPGYNSYDPSERQTCIADHERRVSIQTEFWNTVVVNQRNTLKNLRLEEFRSLRGDGEKALRQCAKLECLYYTGKRNDGNLKVAVKLPSVRLLEYYMEAEPSENRGPCGDWLARYTRREVENHENVCKRLRRMVWRDHEVSGDVGKRLVIRITPLISWLNKDNVEPLGDLTLHRWSGESGPWILAGKGQMAAESRKWEELEF